jgi:hypothetical protein
MRRGKRAKGGKSLCLSPVSSTGQALYERETSPPGNTKHEALNSKQSSKLKGQKSKVKAMARRLKLGGEGVGSVSI